MTPAPDPAIGYAPIESPPARAVRRARLLKIVAVSLLVAVSGFHAVRGALHAQRSLLNDWGVYYLSGIDMRTGENIYNLRGGPMLTFKNAPAVAMAMVPMSMFPAPLSRAAWGALDALLVVLILRMAIGILFQGRPPPSIPDAPIAIALAAGLLTLNYLLYQFQSAQTTLIFIWLTVLSFYLATRGRMFWGGVALSAAVCLKIVPLCFLPYLLIRRGAAKALAGFTAGVIALLLLPALCVGWNANIDLLKQWPAHLRDTQSEDQASRFRNLSIPALVTRLTSPTKYGTNVVAVSDSTGDLITLGIIGLGGALTYVFILLTRRSGDPGERDALHLSLLLLYMTLFNPLGWRYNFVALLVPYAYCVSACWRHPKTCRPILALVAVACAMAWVPRVDGVPALDWLQIIGVRTLAALLLTATCIYHGIANSGCNPFKRTSESDLQASPVLPSV